MNLITIDDADDPRIAPYKNIREKSAIHEDGFFIAEGKFILETLLTRSRFPALSALIAPSRIEPLSDILANAPKQFSLYVASPKVLEAIAGFDVHRGILALGSTTPTQPIMPDQLAKELVLVLSSIANPENVGALIRSASALGASKVILDAQCCHPLYRRAIRVSMGASLNLPWQFGETIETIITQLHVDNFTCYALSPSGKIGLDQTDFAAKSALIMGEEAHGLPAHIIDQMQALSIPMDNQTDSLNVAASGAVALYAARLSQAKQF